ncbi:MAG TPA: glycosyl transferase [Thermoclostridium caenicola]|nr:glycosyl transferase [Thermoclostridium caenicola]
MVKEIVSRKVAITPADLTKSLFPNQVSSQDVIDAVFSDSSYKGVIAVSGLKFKAPAVIEILKKQDAAEYLNQLVEKGYSVLIQLKPDGISLYQAMGNEISEAVLPQNLQKTLYETLKDADKWAGYLNEEGEHVIDLRSPAPGPHFYVNLLMGNRVGFPSALQTTPKSVVDRFGGGSFRSHAASQVLATRWDMRQEENGFPANRQFYLAENNQKIFYSAEPAHPNILEAKCIHSRNHTRIIYKTKCGLEIRRLIFILPQYKGLPLATEVQRIEIVNHSGRDRNLRLVYTGMFGNFNPMGQWEDVLYTNVIMQGRVLRNEDGSIMAIGPDYYPPYTHSDQRYHVMMVRNGNSISYPTEFCTDYNEFVGVGSLNDPQGLMRLSNRLHRKGPGFFAVAATVSLGKGETRVVDNFTGMVSDKTNPEYNYHDTYVSEIKALCDTFSAPGALEEAFDKNMKFLDEYSSFIQLQSSNELMNTYFNKNLPFQVLYQTFVSRSFCQTQKGYREIGFREIQDIFASMYYFVAMGLSDFVKQLLKEWCSMVFEFGYAYHNFFWVGKESGKWSDDALWFIQAVYRYINLTGDIGFLDETCTIAGTDGKVRPIYETIKAIIHYSLRISIGKHGLPLIDRADWNDTLQVDPDAIDGITKEKLYKEQIAKSGNPDEPFKSDFSESVMNAFLLKLALDEAAILAGVKGDAETKSYFENSSQELAGKIQTHAWKENYFARVLINRYPDGKYTYLGAKGDGFSIDPNIDGVYFLNSFSWSILSDTATDEQIGLMLDVVDKTLKTPYGLKLVSPSDLGPITNISATDHYFPGDRENGGVFKHACMMATSAMFKAAKRVKDPALAQRLAEEAWWMIDITVPFRTMKSPFEICGNPRFCTQYNNSETGENIGPMLSGTSTWLILTLMSAFGIEYTSQGILFEPILRPEEEELRYTLNTGRARYHVAIRKGTGFKRISGSSVVEFDGQKLPSNMVPLMADGKDHTVSIIL